MTELKDALETAKKREDSLQQKIVDLQFELEEQKESMQKQQKDLEKITQLSKELEKAKAAAVQLAQTNEKLIQEITTLKKANEIKENKEEKVNLKIQEQREPEHRPRRPIQKESEKPADFASKSWLL
ncbi:MAG TPA: hypothetical protein V6D26_00055 [Stenomitos sp.]